MRYETTDRVPRQRKFADLGQSRQWFCMDGEARNGVRDGGRGRQAAFPRKETNPENLSNPNPLDFYFPGMYYQSTGCLIAKTDFIEPVNCFE